MSDLLTELEEKKRNLNRFRPLNEDEKDLFAEEFCVSFTYNSNAIEGSSLTLSETALVLEGLTIGEKPLKDHIDAVGHRDAFYYIRELVRKNIPLSERIIKEIHSLALISRPFFKGRYREVPAAVRGSLHTPPDPRMVPEMMESLLDRYHAGRGPAASRLAAFHLEFESIHPFADGNGRTGRLLVNFGLMKEGFPPIDIKFTDRKRYYSAFNDFHKTGSPSAMENPFIEYIGKELDRTLHLLEIREKAILKNASRER